MGPGGIEITVQTYSLNVELTLQSDLSVGWIIVGYCGRRSYPPLLVVSLDSFLRCLRQPIASWLVSYRFVDQYYARLRYRLQQFRFLRAIVVLARPQHPVQLGAQAATTALKAFATDEAFFRLPPRYGLARQSSPPTPSPSRESARPRTSGLRRFFAPSGGNACTPYRACQSATTRPARCRCGELPNMQRLERAAHFGYELHLLPVIEQLGAIPNCCAAAYVLRLSEAKHSASALKASSYLRRLSSVFLLFSALLTQELYILPLCA